MTPIKRLMTKHGLTVRDLALLTGATTRMVEYWRAGRWPTPRAVELVLIALDENRIDIEWLVEKIN